MKNQRRYLSIVFVFVVFCLLSTGMPGFAQAPGSGSRTTYQPIRKVDLGVTSLTLDPGEKYTFSVSFDPEDPPVTRLVWFNTDNTVVGLNQLTNTVTALKPGTVRVMAESFDREAYAVCEITVSGKQGKDLSGMTEGKSLLTLSEADRRKIRASQVSRYLDLLEVSVLNETSFRKIQNLSMQVMAAVRPGTEEAESERALALGMRRAYPMKNLHLVSLHGSFVQILDFVKENEDLIRIFKGHDIYLFDPLPETDSDLAQSKAGPGKETTTLEGKVEELTSVSIIHRMGYTGKGTTIAIIDTGLNRSHEQFEGRVAAENCFSWSWNCKPIEGCEPCDADDVDCDIYQCYDCDNNIISACEGGFIDEDHYGETYSAFPGGAAQLDEFNHGSHAAGIAAGRNGMAPGANIVPVQVQSEFYSPYNISEDNPDGYTVTLWNHDIYAGYDWLLEIQEELKNEGKPISVLNLSLGGGAYTEFCDDDIDCQEEYTAFQDLKAAGILPVAASGNEFQDDAVSSPGCLSSGMTVGALAAIDDPYIVSFSNHSPMVDILAPGSFLWSAYLVNNEGVPTTDCYGPMSGTSMATPAVSGALALIMEAFPGKTPDKYKAMIVEMSTKTADRRNSNEYNFDTVDGTGTVFPYKKPILDFSDFRNYYRTHTKQPDTLKFFRIGDLSPLTDCVLPKTGFSALRPQELSSQPLNLQYTPLRMTIQLPTIDAEADIVTVPETDGEYPVEWLGASVGMLEGSSLPGEGITILTGHNHLNSTEAGPFALLRDLEIGDNIMITDYRGAMKRWHVYANEKIPADGFSRVAGDLQENSLVLITCEDEREEGGYLNRRVVLAN